MNLQAPIRLDLTVEEVNGIMAALGELPTKTRAYTLMETIREQATPQLPAEEPKDE
jgi:hypothetical protein